MGACRGAELRGAELRAGDPLLVLASPHSREQGDPFRACVFIHHQLIHLRSEVRTRASNGTAFPETCMELGRWLCPGSKNRQPEEGRGAMPLTGYPSHSDR